MLLADALIIAMIGFFELGSGFEQLWLSAISFGAEFHMRVPVLRHFVRCMIHHSMCVL
jgi:hypothetical protein